MLNELVPFKVSRWVQILFLTLPLILATACGDDDDDDDNNDDMEPEMETPVDGRIRLVSIDPANDEISIRNFTAETTDISSYQFCSLFNYGALSSFEVTSGSLNLGPNETVVISGWNLDDTASDVGLYISGPFSDAANLVDYMQYNDTGIGRESVADSKGIWTAGESVDGTGPFTYIGDGSEDGAEFWQ